MRSLGESALQASLSFGPFVAIFAAFGAPGLKFGGLVLQPYLIVLAALILLSFAVRSDRWLRSLIRTPGIAVLSASFMLLLLVVVFAKQAPFAETRQIKNAALPMAMAFVATSRMTRTPKVATRVALASAIGITISFLLVYSSLGTSLLAIRGVRIFYFSEAAGYSYIWLGVGGCFVMLTAGFFVFQSSLATPYRFTLVFLLGAGLVMAVISGTRAVLVSALLSPPALFLVRRTRRGVVETPVAILLTAVFAVSLFPAILKPMFPPTLSPIVAATQGSERLLESSGYQHDFINRVVWWDAAIYDQGPFAFLFGCDYAQSVQNLARFSVGHPHNMMVWTRVIAGAPTAFLLFLGLVLVLFRSLDLYRRSPPLLRPLCGLNASTFVVILSVLFTNSWVGGTPVLLGVNIALTMALSSHTTGPNNCLSAALTTSSQQEQGAQTQAHHAARHV